ncbi:hypothetical protein JCM3765_003163 [Sporobolomyces pararoseus]
MPPLARTNSRPTFGKAANKYISRGCFGDNGEVWCFCNTDPRIEALRRVTRKESSPNLGREFYSCGNWQEPKCDFFLWVDESALRGRQKVTPPPSEGSTSNAPRQPTTPARLPVPSSSRSPSKRPHSPDPPRSVTRQPLPASERLDDINLDEFSNTLSDDDDIEDPDTDLEPDTQHSTSSMPSPTKKPRFTSFSTPSKPQNNAYAEIKNDPDSPFHSIKKNLFGGAGGNGIDSTPRAPPSSSPSKPPLEETTSSGPIDPLTALTTHLDSIPNLLASVKKDKEKDLRLIEVGKRKEELWKKKSGKLEEENGRLKGEMEGLKEKVRRLEEEVRELRTRR